MLAQVLIPMLGRELVERKQSFPILGQPLDRLVVFCSSRPQIIATEPTVEKLGEAILDEADSVASTEPNDAKNVPVGAERRKLDRMISPPTSASD
jgi:hypothetical protein